MAAQVLSFFQRSPRYAPKTADWTQQELAEFYRVESALIRAGIRVGTDRGLSDENEPWFVFYRSDDGEVVIHFARIDDEYIIAGPAYEEIARGFDFTALVRNMVARHPLIRRSDNNSNLSIHPAALLVAVVGTAFFKTGEARAAETGQSTAQSGHNRPVLLSSSSSTGLTNGVAPANLATPTYDSVQLPANQAVLVLAAALLASNFSIDTSTTDATARTAVAAAAASLDFGGVSVTAPSMELFTPVATTHAVIENTAVHTISSVLSLVAVLSTLPSLTDTLAPTGLASTDASAGEHSAFAAPSSAVNEANWSIDVSLGAGALPSVQAVQLVRGVFGEASYQTVSVIELAKLPDVLAKIIASSSNHYNVQSVSLPSTTTTSTTLTNPETTTPVTPPTDTSSSGGHIDPGQVTPPITPPVTVDPVTPPATGGGIIETPTSPTTPTTPTAPTTPELPSTLPSGFATRDMVQMFVDYFMDHTAKVEVIVTGSSIVAFDARVLHDPGSIQNLDSITFSFDDGTSVSLVGEHSAILQHPGLLH